MAKNLDISTLLDFYGDMLNDLQRDFVELYHNEDLSLAEISEHKSITRQGVRDNIKRGENALLELEQKLGFYAKYKEICTSINEIKQLLIDISNINQKGAYSTEIAHKLERVDHLCDQCIDVL